jgi:putative ABC transport system permease protein
VARAAARPRVGAPLERLGGMTGRLARENATRNPGRTAVTAASLMIGLALVTFVTIFAAGLRGSVDRVVDRSFAGDLTVSNLDGFSPVAATLPPSWRRCPASRRPAACGSRTPRSSAAPRT